MTDLNPSDNPLAGEPRSMGGDLNMSRRCFYGDHIACRGEWTAYPDLSGPCECADVNCPCNPGPDGRAA